ncbi:MAG: hypothetical protein ACYCY8_06590 [Burkholderiales bacterium]
MRDQLTQDMKRSLINSFLGTWRYGYFAPIIALKLTITRSGHYFWHLKALYRLSYWHGDLTMLARKREHDGHHKVSGH